MTRTPKLDVQKGLAHGTQSAAPLPQVRAEPGEPTLKLQRRIGNQATTQWIQARLAGESSDDHLEHEAGHMAGEIPSSVNRALDSPGRQLDRDMLKFGAKVFGRDFSGVRVHTDAQAAGSASEVNALAYTVDDHIVFGAGQYQPQTTAGRKLLVHEMTHVVQQAGGAPGAQAAPSPGISSPSDPAELEADRISDAALAGGSVATHTIEAPPVRVDSHSSAQQSRDTAVSRIQRQATAPTTAPTASPTAPQLHTYDEYKENKSISDSKYAQNFQAGRISPYPGCSLSWDMQHSLEINADFELIGTGANAAMATAIQSAIQTHWNKPFGSFNVIANVKVAYNPAKPTGSPDKAIIELFRHPTKPSTIVKSGSGKPQNRRITLNTQDNWDVTWTPAHEFGHYLGLDDKYKNTRNASGKVVSVPLPGWAGDMMATTGGAISYWNVLELLAWWANWAT